MRNTSVYVCQSCGFESPKWQGRCPSCGEWNSLVETAVSTRKSPLRRGFAGQAKSLSKPLRLNEVESLKFSRVTTGISELDRVLGGGIVPGSVVLLAGEPGMGKSTLLTQLAITLSDKEIKNQISPASPSARRGRAKIKITNKKLKITDNFLNNVLYVCGEESPGQVKLRVERIKNKNNSDLYLLPETNVESILVSAEQLKPSLMIIDSIQTMWTERLTGMAGSVGQIRECTQILLQFAKERNMPIFLIGHVTKEGAIAGPKILEHLVDTVLYVEGERAHEFRILRAAKNRFGPTDEVGIFVMEDKGMKEVKNPSEIFIQNQKIARAGSCTVVTMQGVRPVLVEIQALAVQSQLPVPRRVGRGIDTNRLQILCAVLQKKAGIPLYNQDIFLSVAGGLRVFEPAVDFGICLAIASSYKNKTLTEKSIAIGEVGLLGEIRKVPFLEKRVKQARALGYKNIIGPQQYQTLREAIKELL